MMANFVQVLKEGFFSDKWVDIKGFGDKERAEELLKTLKGQIMEDRIVLVIIVGLIVAVPFIVYIWQGRKGGIG